jgi:hypothetical protein
VEKMLENQNTMSINQTQTHIKLVEMWKANTKIQNYPIPFYSENKATARGVASEKFKIKYPKDIY